MSVNWVGIPSVPLADAATQSFLQAVKNNLQNLRTAVDATATSATSSTSTTTSISGAIYPILTTDYGGIGDSTTDNATAFAAAEAANASTIFIPDGIYLTSVDPSTYKKHYTGSGIILYGSNAYPADFANVANKPTTWPVQGITGWFRGDQTFTDGGEYKTIGTNVRRYDLSARYFESNLIPHHAWFNINSGSSGYNGRFAVDVASGSTSATLTGAGDADWVGHTFAIIHGQDQPAISTHTCTGVSGTTINFTPATSGGPYTAGLYGIKFAPRTWNGHTYIRVQHNGGGDGYGHIVRMRIGYDAPASEDHVFFTATGGQYGGDVDFVTDGCYATGWESQYNDQGHDVAVIAQVDSFNRTNDTGGRGAMWLGSLFQSGGSVPADAAHVIAGKWRVGLDTTRADMSTFVTGGDNLNAAINTALGHRWIMNSTHPYTGRGGALVLGTAMFGSTPGDMYIESGNDGTSDFIALRFNRTAPNDTRLRIRPTQVQINNALVVGGSIGAGTDISLGSTGILAFGPGSGNYLQFDGTNFVLKKGGSTVATW